MSRLSWALVLGCGLMSGCDSQRTASVPRSASSVETERAPPPVSHSASPASSPDGRGTPESGGFRFVDVAAEVGATFRHFSPLTPERHVHLVMGSGVGWLDFDRDGLPDLFCCQGAAFPPESESPAKYGETPSDVLFWNRGNRLINVTGDAGLADRLYSMGIAAADFDNDGFLDLFISGFDENRLFRNCGDGTFLAIEIPAQRSPGRLSASCAWGDVDNDGNLDLFVTNYAQLGPENYPLCTHTAEGRTIAIACHPANLQVLADMLYRNLGTGEFAETGQQSGLSSAPRQGLGVIASDLDFDGNIDFYVANDTTPNQLWQNSGEFPLIDRGVDSGTATNRHGASEAGMGVGVGDVDGNGFLDLFVTNFYYETNTLYRNEGKLQFADVSDEIGLAASSRLRLGFGTSLADFDHDGWLDIFVANGHIHDRLSEIRREEPFAQLPLMYRNQEGNGFREVTLVCGPFFREGHVGRGSAIADYDRDGDLDLAVSHLNAPLALLRNDTEHSGNWVRLELVGRQCNRSAVGALLELQLDNMKLVRQISAGCSYLSCDELALTVGLGACRVIRRLTITWPGGSREQWDFLAANQMWRLTQGAGQPEQLPAR